MAEYHLRDGFTFERLAAGSVRLRLRDAGGSGRILEETTVRDSAWASAVASVSEAGETGEAYASALELHLGGTSEHLPQEGAEP